MPDPAIPANAEGIILKVQVQPRSSRNKILSQQEGILRVALTAPPVAGAANKACIDLLAKELGLKKTQLQIKSGHKSRHKQVLLRGIEPQALAQRLKEILINGRNNRME